MKPFFPYSALIMRQISTEHFMMCRNLIAFINRGFTMMIPKVSEDLEQECCQDYLSRARERSCMAIWYLRKEMQIERSAT